MTPTQEKTMLRMLNEEYRTGYLAGKREVARAVGIFCIICIPLVILLVIVKTFV